VDRNATTVCHSSRKVEPVEVKIGVQNVAREITIDTDATTAEVIDAVSSALDDGGLLRLNDEKGKVVVVPSTSLGYVEIGEPSKGRVGFGA
jgi:hypothetical protein